MNALRKVSAVKIVSAGFILIIIIGALLLNTSIATSDGSKPGFINSLFTSTSAVCVTGLAVFSTGEYWSLFGQCIILILVQIGGLGFMTLAALISFALRRKISLKERIVMAEALNKDELSGVVGLAKNIIFAAAIFETIGAVILSLRFFRDCSVSEAVFKGIFHSVSAFCNAGFDILGSKNGLNSFAHYAYDPVINITLMFLIISGGLGFFVWTDIIRVRSFKKFRTQTKIVLLSTAVLIFFGALLIFISERSNMKTMGALPFGKQVMASLFQSVTCRTAGFETIPQNNFTLPSKLISILLMFIGGSPGSTAGGIKTVTAAVVVMASSSFVRGNENTNFFKRRVDPVVIRRAFTIMLFGIAVVFFSVFIICSIEPYELDRILFEVVSAFGTVGLTCSLTSELTTLSKLVLIFLMYFGRLGILTIMMAIAGRRRKAKELYRYANANITVG